MEIVMNKFNYNLFMVEIIEIEIVYDLLKIKNLVNDDNVKLKIVYKLN